MKIKVKLNFNKFGLIIGHVLLNGQLMKFLLKFIPNFDTSWRFFYGK